MDARGDGLRLTNIAKRFGTTRALIDADLHVRSGEVHTLLGENGSGKSTLVKIIGGVHHPDAGTFALDGETAALRNPRDAGDNGIAVVFQEVLTAQSQSVLDNIWLGSGGLFVRRTSRAAQRTIAAEVLSRFVDNVSIDQPAAELSLSERQVVCIVRALVREPRVLVLDESTAALDVLTRGRLFVEMRRLASEGASILFISHRMDEVEEVSDRVTVLRTGRTISTVERAAMSVPQLITDMTGVANSEREGRGAHELGPVTLRAERVRLAPSADPIDFELRRGELVGLAGLEGHGQDSFIKRLAGLWQGGGTCLRIDERGVERSVRYGRGNQLGVAYLPRERRGESLFEPMSIKENFALPTLQADLVGGMLISGKRMAERFKSFTRRFDVRFGRSSDPISSLSGGNQQKVVLARWLATKPEVLLLNDPTRGVDISTKREIYKNLEQLCADGMSVVMLTSEVDELVGLVDRVLVFRDNQVFAEIPRDEVSAEAVVSAYFGQRIGANV